MRLIKDWRQSWRFYSLQATIVAGALQGAYMALPTELRERVPSDFVDALTIAVLVLGAIGRLVDQNDQKA